MLWKSRLFCKQPKSPGPRVFVLCWSPDTALSSMSCVVLGSYSGIWLLSGKKSISSVWVQVLFTSRGVSITFQMWLNNNENNNEQ